MNASMSETETERGPYLTRVTVAGNRLSDLIDALRRLDPDTRIRVRYVEREDRQIRLDDVEAITSNRHGPVFTPGAGAFL